MAWSESLLWSAFIREGELQRHAQLLARECPVVELTGDLWFAESRPGLRPSKFHD